MGAIFHVSIFLPERISNDRNTFFERTIVDSDWFCQKFTHCDQKIVVIRPVPGVCITSGNHKWSGVRNPSTSEEKTQILAAMTRSGGDCGNRRAFFLFETLQSVRIAIWSHFTVLLSLGFVYFGCAHDRNDTKVAQN